MKIWIYGERHTRDTLTMAQTARQEQSASNRKLRVIVVDDSQIILRTVSGFLCQDEAVEVVATAEAGREALELTARLQPDLLVLDLQLPGVSGLQICEIVTRRFPDIYVAIMTVHDGEMIRAACRQAGAHTFISKQSLWEELSRAVELANRNRA